jgi:hypothetical protein
MIQYKLWKVRISKNTKAYISVRNTKSKKHGPETGEDENKMIQYQGKARIGYQSIHQCKEH